MTLNQEGEVNCSDRIARVLIATHTEYATLMSHLSPFLSNVTWPRKHSQSIELSPLLLCKNLLSPSSLSLSLSSVPFSLSLPLSSCASGVWVCATLRESAIRESASFAVAIIYLTSKVSTFSSPFTFLYWLRCSLTSRLGSSESFTRCCSLFIVIHLSKHGHHGHSSHLCSDSSCSDCTLWNCTARNLQKLSLAK